MRTTQPGTAATMVVLCAAWMSSPASADTYLPFQDFRAIDPSGRYYLVVKKDGGPANPGSGTPVRFAIAERKAGSPPVAPAEDGEGDFFRTVVANPEVTVREGDTVLGRGRLKRCPDEILISSSGLGFVGLDVRGYNYGDLRSGNALVIVSNDGTVRHGKDLIDLFTEREVARFVHTAGGVHWCGGGWIDEARKRVVVLGSGMGSRMQPIPRLFRVVSLETGAVREGSANLVLDALFEIKPAPPDVVLDLAAELRLGASAAGPRADLFRRRAPPLPPPSRRRWPGGAGRPSRRRLPEARHLRGAGRPVLCDPAPCPGSTATRRPRYSVTSCVSLTRSRRFAPGRRCTMSRARRRCRRFCNSSRREAARSRSISPWNPWGTKAPMRGRRFLS